MLAGRVDWCFAYGILTCEVMREGFVMGGYPSSTVPWLQHPMFSVQGVPVEAKLLAPMSLETWEETMETVPYVLMSGADVVRLVSQLRQLTADLRDLHRAVVELDVIAADAQGSTDPAAVESALEALVDLASAALARTDPDPVS